MRSVALARARARLRKAAPVSRARHKLTSRKERHERKRRWCSYREALSLIEDWDSLAPADEKDADAWKRGGSKKKRAKGHAFKRALLAFVEKYEHDTVEAGRDEKAALL